MSKRKYSKEFKLKVLGEHEEDDLARQNSNLCQYMAEFKKEVGSGLSVGRRFWSVRCSKT